MVIISFKHTVINIDGTDDILNGRLSSWNVLKTLKIKAGVESGYGIYVNKSLYNLIDGTTGSNESVHLQLMFVNPI